MNQHLCGRLWSLVGTFLGTFLLFLPNVQAESKEHWEQLTEWEGRILQVDQGPTSPAVFAVLRKTDERTFRLWTLSSLRPVEASCFSRDSFSCELDFNFHEQLTVLTSLNRGVDILTAKEVGILNDEIPLLASFRGPSLKVRTDVIGSGKGVVEFENSLNGIRYRSRLYLASYFRSAPPQFQFENLQPPKVLSWKQVEARDLKWLASAVFRFSVKSSDRLSRGSSRFHGTGFFISPNGYFISNHHVGEEDQRCLAFRDCTVEVEHQDKTGRLIRRKLQVDFLSISPDFDFVLGKARLEEGAEVNYLRLGREGSWGPSVVTLGFPGERTKDKGGPLTYSFGSITSLYNQNFMTSIWNGPGASGSPLLDLKTLKVFGLVYAVDPVTERTIAIPMSEIVETFDLYGYFTGRKQERVDKIIRDIEQSCAGPIKVDASGKSSMSSTHLLALRKLLRAYQEERTYLGFHRLRQLLSEDTLAAPCRMVLNDWFINNDWIRAR